MKRAKFLKIPPCALPDVKSEKEVMAKSQILEVGGEKAAEISLYYKNQLKARYFADEENHYAWINDKWTTCRLDNVARMCKNLPVEKGAYYWNDKKFIWNTKEDEQRVIDFLDVDYISSYEEKISKAKREKARARKSERIAKEMSDVPCVTEDMERWLDEKVFPGHILFSKKEGKGTAYTCTACKGSGSVKEKWKHKEIVHCPKCNQIASVNNRQKQKVEHTPVVILQKCNDRWVERQFKAICRWSKEGKEIKLFEQCRAFIPMGKTYGKVYYGTIDNADEFEQNFWDKNPAGKRFSPSYLYPGNLKEVLPCGNLERSGMDILAYKGKKFYVNRYITCFHARQYWEYLVKSGLYELVTELCNGYWRGELSIHSAKARNLKELLRVDGNRVNRMKQIDGGVNELEWLQYEQGQGIKISKESLEWLSKKKMTISKCKEILNDLGSVNKMVNYLKKQKIAPSKVIITWRDYLRMALLEGYDTRDSIVRFPKDLKLRHDQLVERRNEKLDKERLNEYAEIDKQIQERLPEVRRYFYEDDTYMIIPAGKCKELMKEGRELHHCVGASDIYMKKMAAGETWILFLRKKSDLEKAYYTVEINLKTDKIIQFYSEFDRQPDKKVIEKLLNKYTKRLKTMKQPIMAAAV